MARCVFFPILLQRLFMARPKIDVTFSEKKPKKSWFTILGEVRSRLPRGLLTSTDYRRPC